MINTTLCYIFRGEDCLLLHRNKKKNDLSQEKWIGLGGKFLEGESPEECVLREVKEESGLTLEDYSYRGIVTFVSDQCEGEFMHLFTGTKWSGELTDCDEGELHWKPFELLFTLPRWEGDDIFLKLLPENTPFFSLKIVYKGNQLVEAYLDGEKIK